MIRRETDDLIAFLNSLILLDAQAVTDLIESRAPCNEALANHPSVQVGLAHGKRRQFQVGLLGLLNGYCGRIDGGPRSGWGPITADFNNGIVTRFVRTESEVQS